MRDRTLEGYWWLPGRADNKIAGILTYDGGDPSLRLLGGFRPQIELGLGVISPETAKEAPLILGTCEGKQVTLVDCRQRSFRMKWGSTDDWRQTFDARLMLVGIWLDETDEEYFDQIAIGIDHLLPWSKQSGLERQYEQSDDHWRTSVKWEDADDLTARVGDAVVELRLGCTTKRTTRADRTEELTTEHAGLAVTVPEPRSATALIDQWTRPLQDLVTLAMDTPCGLHEITLIRRKPPEAASPDDEASPVRPVKVEAYLAPLYRAKPDDMAVQDHRALFTLKDIRFSELLTAWFEVHDRVGPVIGMLLGQRYIGRSFVENRLITAVAAAEGLHRRLLADETYLPPPQFEEMKTALINAVPREHVEWLASRLWNEPSLKQRLLQLAERVGFEVIEQLVPKPNRWARESPPTPETC